MKVSSRRIYPAAFLCLALLSQGCGSADKATSMLTPSSLSISGAQRNQEAPVPTPLFGKAQLLLPLAGASVQILDPSGQPLLTAPLTTSAAGLFESTDPLPPNFRVVVTPSLPVGVRAAAENNPIWREVRNFSNDGTMLNVNAVSHLVAVYLGAHPELSLDQAEERVRRFLVIPSWVDLNTGLDSESGYFSHALFLRAAEQAGGLGPYCQSLVVQLDAGLTQPFVLAESGGALSGLTANVVGDLIANPISAGLNQAVGWVASLVGFNFGGPSLADISNQIQDVQNQLTQLQNQIALQTLTLEYTTDQAALEGNVATITSTSTQLSTTASNAAQATNPPNPITDPPDAQLIALLQAQNWTAMGTEILDYLLGRNSAPNNMVNLYSAIIMSSAGADSNPAQYQGYPLRSNALLRQQQSQLTYYLQVLSLVMNLIAETSHLCTRDPQTSNFNSNADAIMVARSSLMSFIADARRALQQLPDPLASDQVLVDMENGATWYLSLVTPTGYSGASEFPQKVVTGPYGSSDKTGPRFTLASQAQLDALRQRLLVINPNSPTQALISLGFTGIDPSKSLVVWMDSPGWSDNNNPPSDYHPEAYTYRLNDGETTKINTAKDFTSYPYLMTLPFPGAAEQDPNNPLLASGRPGTLSVQSASATQLQALALNNPVSSGGTFTVSGKSRTVPVQTVTRASDDVTGDVVWTSSNPSVAEVSNLDGSQGQILWHPDSALSPVTFMAALQGQAASLTVNPPSPLAPATLQGIQVLPTNLLYGLPARNEYFHATGFYSDQRAVNLDNQVIWSVVDSASNQTIPPAQAGFITSEPNLLVISSQLTSPRLTVQATLGNLTGSAQIEVPIVSP